MEEIRAVSASGILGYGFPKESLDKSLAMNPHFIACDAGSTDPGPYYLGSGKSFISKAAVKRDLRLLLKAARLKNIPLIIGSAGGTGSNAGVQFLTDILDEITEEESLHFKLAVIRSEIDRDYLLNKFKSGKISPLSSTVQITEETIKNMHKVVGMMGPQPIMKALDEGADVIITGRATDASVFSAVALKHNMNPGPAWHAAKIIECGAATAFPKSHDCIMAYIRNDEFVIETPNPKKTLPWKNVAAHTMYENTSPFHIKEPGGTIDTTKAVYEQLTPSSVRVTRSQFTRAESYTIKFESVEKIGYRSVCLAGLRDPILLSQLDDYLDFVREELRGKLDSIYNAEIDHEKDYQLLFRKYGLNGVMGETEPETMMSHEIGLLIDVVATEQELTTAILATTRTLVLHSHFEGRLCISGNTAFPFSPPDISVGEVFSFSSNHVVEPNDPYELFPIEYKEV
ncbi:acyclic terpene utilization AtuA family protein [Robertmurraya massiliosenegalensis]|uniref:acyclic terpene utilization AtuA family protein n=1 Tax=Robertmurraya TaxID=2837507 RepID=UPI0039A5BEB0